MKQTCPIESLPQEERPRERLLRDGVEALSLTELLAIVLTTGTKDKSVLTLAEEIITSFGTLDKLLNATVAELTEVKGIGSARAIQLRAIFGIVHKCRKMPFLEKVFVKTPEEAFALAKSEIGSEKQETVLIILRDVRGGLIHHEKIAIGTLSEVLIHPREVFYPAVRHKAHSLIIAHNHPSGDASPSKADLELTRLLLHSSTVMGIALDDHLIVTPHTFTSLRQLGYLGSATSY
jgi:DNA repair protein RadC